MSLRTMVYLLPCLERSLHVITSPQKVCPTRSSMYGDVLLYIFRNDPRRRLHTTHLPSWLPICPCRMCSSNLVIFFSRLFIPAFAPKTTPSVSLNMYLFHSSWVGFVGIGLGTMLDDSGGDSSRPTKAREFTFHENCWGM